MHEIIYFIQDAADPERDPIKLKITSGCYGPSIEVLHPTTNQAMATASLDYFQNKIQLLGYAMLPDGSAAHEVTNQDVLVEDYQVAISKGLTA